MKNAGRVLVHYWDETIKSIENLAKFMYHKLGLYIGIKPRQHRVTCPTVSVLLLVYNSNQPLLLDLAELPNQRPFFFQRSAAYQTILSNCRRKNMPREASCWYFKTSSCWVCSVSRREICRHTKLVSGSQITGIKGPLGKSVPLILEWTVQLWRWESSQWGQCFLSSSVECWNSTGQTVSCLTANVSDEWRVYPA